MSSHEKLNASLSAPQLGVQIVSVCFGLALYTISSSAFAADKPWLTLETTADVASHGSLYIDSTITFAPLTSIYETGFRLRFTTSFNQYELTDPKRTATNKSAEALMGYVFAFDKASVMFGAGAVVTNKDESGDINSPSTTKAGGKVLVSAYARPSDATMLFGQLSYSSTTQFRLAQGKFGLQVVPNIYAGPEVSISGGPEFTQGRLGAHLTGFSLGKINGGISAGVLRDSNNGSGFYSSLTLRVDM